MVVLLKKKILQHNVMKTDFFQFVHELAEMFPFVVGNRKKFVHFSTRKKLSFCLAVRKPRFVQGEKTLHPRPTYHLVRPLPVYGKGYDLYWIRTTTCAARRCRYTCSWMLICTRDVPFAFRVGLEPRLLTRKVGRLKQVQRICLSPVCHSCNSQRIISFRFQCL